MDSTPKPSLVEALESADRFGLSGVYEFRIGLELHGDYLDRDDVLKIAAPYSARLAALKKVADCALAVVALPLAMREAFDDLRRALAAVPEIPEKTDG